MEDLTGKVKRISAKHLQFMYPAEHYATALPQMEMYGRTAKFINHPSLMPDLYKDLDDDRHTTVDRQTMSTKSTRHVAIGHPQPTPYSYNLQPHDRSAVQVTESKTKLD